MRAYLRAKAILLALVLEPPMRTLSDKYKRTDHNAVEVAHMDFENARGTWKYERRPAEAGAGAKWR